MDLGWFDFGADARRTFGRSNSLLRTSELVDDEGLRCKECGYNLTGLTEPLRCPECGTQKPVPITPNIDGSDITQCTNCGFSFSGGRCPQCGWSYPTGQTIAHLRGDRGFAAIALTFASMCCLVTVGCSIMASSGIRNPKGTSFIMLPSDYMISVLGLACAAVPVSIVGLVLAAFAIGSPYRNCAIFLIVVFFLNWIAVGVYLSR